jgi:hypothetical protein
VAQSIVIEEKPRGERESLYRMEIYVNLLKPYTAVGALQQNL